MEDSMKKKIVAVVALAATLVAGTAVNGMTAQARSFDITKTFNTDKKYYEKKYDISLEGYITLSSGVIPGSCHVNAYLSYKNSNGDFLRGTDGMYFTTNSTESAQYTIASAKGKNFYFTGKVNDSSRFDNTTVTYSLLP